MKYNFLRWEDCVLKISLENDLVDRNWQIHFKHVKFKMSRNHILVFDYGIEYMNINF